MTMLQDILAAWAAEVGALSWLAVAPVTISVAVIMLLLVRSVVRAQALKVQTGMDQMIGALMAKGGIILHGEQEFAYHRPVVVGDVLVGEGHVVDAYAKESKGKTMTFLVTETVWRDEASGEPVVTSRFNLIHRG